MPADNKPKPLESCLEILAHHAEQIPIPSFPHTHTIYHLLQCRGEAVLLGLSCPLRDDHTLLPSGRCHHSTQQEVLSNTDPLSATVRIFKEDSAEYETCKAYDIL